MDNIWVLLIKFIKYSDYTWEFVHWEVSLQEEKEQEFIFP